ncbi:hypothetical protein DFH06DRAFT_1348926 [Mycena polygramma]|nr:hypothetical protein DFH06DRAFT_1348926 [Mycena polygramma]
MVHISRTLAFFAFVSTGLALALTADPTTNIKGVSAGNTDDSAVISEAKMNHHETPVNGELSSGTGNGGSDAITATTFAKDKPVVDAVAAPGFVVNATHATSARITPGSVYYIQNQQGYYLVRRGDTGIGFAVTTAHPTYSPFRATAVPGTDYVTLQADNGLSITLDHNYNPPVLWLNRVYPVGWFQTVPAGSNTEYLYVHNPSGISGGPWAVLGNNYNDGAINTVVYPTGFNGLYITKIY